MANIDSSGSASPSSDQANSQVASSSQASDRTVEADASESFHSITDLRDLILWHRSASQEEENNGCFVLAEQHLKKAYSIASTYFPEEKVTAQVAAELGLFLGRFIPTSRQPIAYLRRSLDIEKHLGTSQAELSSLLIDISQSLIAIGEWADAEEILKQLTEANDETSLRATSHLGRAYAAKGEILQSEQVLREHLQRVRSSSSPNVAVLAEALRCFAETLLAKEAFGEAECIVAEALSTSEDVSEESYLSALQLYSTLRGKTATNPWEDAVFEAAWVKCRDARPYFQAALQECWARASEIKSPEEGVLHSLRAFTLYRSVNPNSWYVVRVLSRLITCILPCNEYAQNAVNGLAEYELNNMSPGLPTASTMLSLDITSIPLNKIFATMLLRCGKTDVLATGEVLQRLLQRYRFSIEESLWDKFIARVDAFVLANPSAEATKELIEFRRQRDVERQACEAAQDSHLVSAFQAVQAARTASPSSLSTAQRLLDLGAHYQSIGDLAHAEACFQETLAIYSHINPNSRLVVEQCIRLGCFYATQGRCEEAEALFSRIDFRVAFDSSVLERVFVFYNEIGRGDKWLTLWVDYLRSLEFPRCRRSTYLIPMLNSDEGFVSNLHRSLKVQMIKYMQLMRSTLALSYPKHESLYCEIERFMQHSGRYYTRAGFFDACTQLLPAFFENEYFIDMKMFAAAEVLLMRLPSMKYYRSRHLRDIY